MKKLITPYDKVKIGQENNMANYIVTGGAGFIGSNLSQALLAAGHTVNVIDNLSGGKKENVPEGATLHEIDITKSDDVNKAFDSVGAIDGVFHMAALPRVEFSIQNPQESHNANVNGLLNVLVASRDHNKAKVVFSASSSAYGDTEVLPTHEELPTNPMSPYALHKLIGEQYCKMFNKIYDLPTVCLRYFNVYGPKCDPNGAYALVIGKFIQMRVENKVMTICGDGTQTRDAVHASDVVRANILAMESSNVKSAEIINIGSGENRSVNELAKMIGGPVEHIDPRLEPHDTLADISRAKMLLGWEPKKTFKDGLEELKKEMGLLK